MPGDKLPSVATGALAAYLKETVAPQVPPQLRGAFLSAIEDGRLRSMLNKQMTLTPLHRPGALLLGDAFNMRWAADLNLAPACCAQDALPEYGCCRCCLASWKLCGRLL